MDWSKKVWSTEDAEKMLEYLQCPICLDAAEKVDVYACANGHYLCGTCKKNLQKNKEQLYYYSWKQPAAKCPMCRDDHLERNKLAESLKRKAHNTIKKNEPPPPPSPGPEDTDENDEGGGGAAEAAAVT